MKTTCKCGNVPVFRRRWRACGFVQGVGFRPFVYRLAHDFGLDGWVRNDPGGVTIEAYGNAAILDRFAAEMRAAAPRPARVEKLETLDDEPADAAAARSGFTILPSVVAGAPTAHVLPDLALCSDCRRELFDPRDRRYRYPFINCTRCGPRFSIVTALPYDRANTTMAGFLLCPACRAEYEEPAHRRFHAQANACPVCGPRLAWQIPGDDAPRAAEDAALRAAEDIIRGGGIVAIKGLGGFQLICDARDDAAVRRLRARKQREAKPLALMTPTLDAARALCHLDAVEARLLAAPEAPIVLAARRFDGAPPIAPSVAPDTPALGVMLPYTPLHHLLLADLSFTVVATSGNRSDEPLCTENGEALVRLRDIADGFLMHDRPIARPLDDSVLRVVDGCPQLLRRARGFAPTPIRAFCKAPADDTEVVPPLSKTGRFLRLLEGRAPSRPFLPPVCVRTSTGGPGGEAVLAVGSQLKNTVALAVGGEVVLSPHLGDLEHALTCEAFERAVALLETFHRVHPAVVAHDLHPDYYSTAFAARHGGRTVAVQHHHAHAVSVMAEHGLDGEVFGVVWDGAGYGADGTIWGGEFLRVRRTDFVRAGHFRPFPLPGGDAAARDPRRAALGLLFAADGADAFARHAAVLDRIFSSDELALWRTLLPRGRQAPLSSSAGRLFDAVAVLTGICDTAAFEGQAAMAVENAAAGVWAEKGSGPWPVVWAPDSDTGAEWVWDWRPALAGLLSDRVAGRSAAYLAARFHRTLIAVIAAAAQRAALPRVVLAGGCFQNRLLLEGAIAALRAAGLTPYWSQAVPPNDGGIALGQAAVAVARLQSRAL